VPKRRDRDRPHRVGGGARSGPRPQDPWYPFSPIGAGYTLIVIYTCHLAGKEQKVRICIQDIIHSIQNNSSKKEIPP